MTVDPRVRAAHDPAEPTDAAAPSPRSRRALLVAAVGGVIGVAAGALGRPQPADAAAGDPMRLGQSNTAGSSQTVLNSSAGGAAFTLKDTAVGGTGQFGWSSALTGTGRGLYGRADSASGFGIDASNTATGPGGGAALRAVATATHAIVASTSGAGSYALKATNLEGPALDVTAGGNGINVDANEYAIFARSFGQSGIGVLGYGGGTESFGVIGETEGAAGVYGIATTGHGMSGQATSGVGVSGYSSTGYGVVGSSATEAVRGTSFGGVGVVGGSTTGTGVYGESVSGYAGSFIGDVFVSGTVDGAALATTIDHPLDPAERLLQLGSIGSSERLVQTGGTAELDPDGSATVALPDWFAAMHDGTRHQLTAVGTAMPDLHVVSSGRDAFRIAGGAPGARVDWQVVGVRRDAWAVANPLRLERAKQGKERGRFVHPAAHGQGAERSLAALHGPKRSVHEAIPEPAAPKPAPRD